MRGRKSGTRIDKGNAGYLLAVVRGRLWATSGRVGVVIGVVGGTALGLRDALAILTFFGSRISACSPGLCRTPYPCAFSVCRGPPRRARCWSVNTPKTSAMVRSRETMGRKLVRVRAHHPASGRGSSYERPDSLESSLEHWRRAHAGRRRFARRCSGRSPD